MNFNDLVFEVLGSKRGTAFLVNKNYALTAWHVIEEDIVAKNQIMLCMYKDGCICQKNIRFRVIDKNPNLDVALLLVDNINELNSEIHLFPTISNLLPQKKDEWHAIGFPQRPHEHARDQRLIEGKVYETLKNAVNYKYDIELECELVNYDFNVGFGGLSGAPLIIDNCIQGIIVKEEYSNLKLPFKAISMHAITEFLSKNGIEFKTWSPKIIALNNYWKSKEIEAKSLTDNNDYVESPIMNEWINFINTKSWREEQDDNLHYLKNDLFNARIPEFSGRIVKVREMFARQNYSVIINEYRNLLADIIERLEQYSNERLKEIRDGCIYTLNDLLTPYFSKCFLIIGDSGSGKTCFTRMILGNDSYNIINLNKYLKKNKFDLKEIILEEIFEMAGEKYDTLDDFMNKWQSGNFNQKIFIVIDDLHNWQFRNHNFIYDLIDFIRTSTKYYLLHWVITIQYNYYEMIAKGEFSNIWKTYSTKFEKNSHHLNYWLKLDDYNKEARFGITMIKKFCKVYEYKKFDMLNQYIINQLSTPFIASIIIKLLCEGKNFNQIINLRYTEYIEEYEELQINSLTRSFPDICDSNQIKKALNLIYEQLLTNLNMKILHEAGENALNSSLKISQDIKSILHLLISAGMLVKEIEEPKLSGYPNQIYIKVKEGAFGEYRTALTLLQKFYSIQGMSNFVSSCARLNEINNNMYKSEMSDFVSGVNEYFLLVLDKIIECTDDKETYINSFINVHGLFIVAAWVAGVKTNIQTQNIIFKLSQQISSDIKYKYLFEYMYFLLESDETVIKSVECLKFLQEQFRGILEKNLVGYYIYIVTKLIRQIKEPNILVDCMAYVNGCEVLGNGSEYEDIAITLANISIDQLWNICGDNFINVMELFEEFLNKIDAYSLENSKRNGDKWICSHYYEWVISSQCWRLICELGTDAIDLFNQYKWFEVSKNQTEKRKKHEATKAISQYYMTMPKVENKFKDYIVQYIMNLCNSKESNDLINAYYLIYCTVPSNLAYKHGGIIAQEFIPALEKLCELALLGKKTLRRDILLTKTQYPALYKNTIGPVWNKVKKRMGNSWKRSL